MSIFIQTTTRHASYTARKRPVHEPMRFARTVRAVVASVAAVQVAKLAQAPEVTLVPVATLRARMDGIKARLAVHRQSARDLIVMECAEHTIQTCNPQVVALIQADMGDMWPANPMGEVWAFMRTAIFEPARLPWLRLLTIRARGALVSLQHFGG